MRPTLMNSYFLYQSIFNNQYFNQNTNKESSKFILPNNKTYSNSINQKKIIFDTKSSNNQRLNITDTCFDNNCIECFAPEPQPCDEASCVNIEWDLEIADYYFAGNPLWNTTSGKATFVCNGYDEDGQLIIDPLMICNETDSTIIVSQLPNFNIGRYAAWVWSGGGINLHFSFNASCCDISFWAQSYNNILGWQPMFSPTINLGQGQAASNIYGGTWTESKEYNKTIVIGDIKHKAIRLFDQLREQPSGLVRLITIVPVMGDGQLDCSANMVSNEDDPETWRVDSININNGGSGYINGTTVYLDIGEDDINFTLMSELSHTFTECVITGILNVSQENGSVDSITITPQGQFFRTPLLSVVRGTTKTTLTPIIPYENCECSFLV